MQIKAEEISSIIRQQIAGYEAEIDIQEVGTVISVGDGVARIYGLERCMALELVEFPGDVFGVALNLEEDNVGAVLLSEASSVREGDTVKRTGRVIQVPIGEALLGRVVTPLGEPVDGLGPVNASEFGVIERIAPGVVDRQSVSEPLQTGIKSIDSMIPIGRGQRELIIGDRQTGKTAVALDAIINKSFGPSSWQKPIETITRLSTRYFISTITRLMQTSWLSSCCAEKRPQPLRYFGNTKKVASALLKRVI